MTHTTCTCHPGTTCTSAASCATARELHFGAQPAAVSDAEIDAVTLEQWGPDAIRAAHRQYARAILALRPQSESEQEKELRRSLAEAQATISERNAEIIELQKRIRRSPQAVPMTGWVSVKDRLPPRFQEVLVTFHGVDLPSTGQYTGNQRDHQGWCYPSENLGTAPDEGDPVVTHWMPLPPAPHHGITAPAGGEKQA